MSWILTQSGRRFDLFEPTAAMIEPSDIAHALSNICRFNGHTRAHYSVAQHSVLVSLAVPAEDALAGLLHDATEAYVGDMVRPLKQQMPDYQAAEAAVWRAVCERFQLAEDLPDSVKRADMIMLATERRDLMPHSLGEWECLRGVEPLPSPIKPWTPKRAREAFRDRLTQLLQVRAETQRAPQ